MQTIIYEVKGVKKIKDILNKLGSKKVFIVCDDSYNFLSIKNDIDSLSISHVFFNDFTPNPLYNDVCKGVDLFNQEECDAILAVGGGSSIDVAKCIKLYCKMNKEQLYLEQEYKDSCVPLLAIPTTAGTGSESTRYAVIYYEGKKQSITHESIVPNYAILDSSVLITLPLYQKKCTMLDALCQGIESWWSVNSTDESKEYSKEAISLIMTNYNNYLLGDLNAANNVLLAANYAGRAINITQTTAAHAMSYKITSLYGLPHGHAVVVCLPPLWEHMNANITMCIDPRGVEYLTNIFCEIANALHENSIDNAIDRIKELLKELKIKNPIKQHSTDIDILTMSVNPVRLKNNPISLNEDELRKLYEKIVEDE